MSANLILHLASYATYFFCFYGVNAIKQFLRLSPQLSQYSGFPLHAKLIASLLRQEGHLSITNSHLIVVWRAELEEEQRHQHLVLMAPHHVAGQQSNFIHMEIP